MITILVACHKPYAIPRFSPYYPVEVGACCREDLNLGGARDNQGENISEKNPNFCELTALYWAWKNLDSSHQFIGLVHYRRYFGQKKGADYLSDVYSEEEWREVLKTNSIVLPPKRNYFIETVRSQYIHAHHKQDLQVLREVLKTKHPRYLKAFDVLMEGTKTHIYNMFVMRRDLFDNYCEWLFDVLFEVEKRLDISDYSKNDARVFGFLSERLIDVWLDTNEICYKEEPLIFSETTNWVKKGTSFLLRKLGLHSIG